MSHLSNEIVTKTVSTEVEGNATVSQISAASTKDSGRVKVGGISIRFKAAGAATKDAGRVKVGGISIRY